MDETLRYGDSEDCCLWVGPRYKGLRELAFCLPQYLVKIALKTNISEFSIFYGDFEILIHSKQKKNNSYKGNSNTINHKMLQICYKLI